MEPPADEKRLPEDNGTSDGGAIGGRSDIPPASADGIAARCRGCRLLRPLSTPWNVDCAG